VQFVRLNTQLNLSIHAGALTALEYLGTSHYLPLGERPRVTLFATAATKLPKWVQTAFGEVHLEYYATGLFGDHTTLGMTEKDCGSYSVACSGLERAMLEFCYTVQTDSDFEHALRLMEFLHEGVHVETLQQLLECCESVKVKRLFLYLADHHDLPWLDQLNTQQVSLGSGPRQLSKEGVYDLHFKITVPKFMLYERMNKPEYLPY